jgi:ABC-type sulfate/molybdate transport systems ATPase subunit
LADYWKVHQPTVLLVTHDLAEAVELSNRIVVLAPETGRIAADRQIALPYPRSPLDTVVAGMLDDLRDLTRNWPVPETDSESGSSAHLSGTGAFSMVGKPAAVHS